MSVAERETPESRDRKMGNYLTQFPPGPPDAILTRPAPSRPGGTRLSPLRGSGGSRSPARGCPPCPRPHAPPSARAPRAAPCPSGRPGRLLTFPSPPPRVWPARRAAPGQGRGAGGRGAGLGGSGRVRAGGAGTVPKGGEGAAGSPRARGRARPSRRRGGGREPEEGRQGPGRWAGSSSLRNLPGSRARRGRETPSPGKLRTRRADRGWGDGFVASADKSIRARRAGALPPALRCSRLPGRPRAASCRPPRVRSGRRRGRGGGH